MAMTEANKNHMMNAIRVACKHHGVETIKQRGGIKIVQEAAQFQVPDNWPQSAKERIQNLKDNQKEAIEFVDSLLRMM
jgi:hypothetical protein